MIVAKWGKKRGRLRLFRSWGSLRTVKTVAWGGNARAKPTVSKSNGTKWGINRVFGRVSGKKKNRPSLFSIPGVTPKRRIRKRNLLLMSLLLLLLFFMVSFIFIERNLRPPLMNIAKVRVKQVATQAINKAITEQVARKSESDKLIEWKLNGDGKISGFMLNYAEHMSITSETIGTVQNTLNEIMDIPEHIPIGHALNSAIISSFGPRVPVKFEPVGAVKVELSTRERNAAINMVLVEVYIRVTAEVSIIIPFDTEPELVETDIPISYLLVVGDVPMYYYDSAGKPVGENAPQAPNISVPLAPGAGVSSNPKGLEEKHETEDVQKNHDKALQPESQ